MGEIPREVAHLPILPILSYPASSTPCAAAQLRARARARATAGPCPGRPPKISFTNICLEICRPQHLTVHETGDRYPVLVYPTSQTDTTAHTSCTQNTYNHWRLQPCWRAKNWLIIPLDPGAEAGSVGASESSQGIVPVDLGVRACARERNFSIGDLMSYDILQHLPVF